MDIGVIRGLNQKLGVILIIGDRLEFAVGDLEAELAIKGKAADLDEVADCCEFRRDGAHGGEDIQTSIFTGLAWNDLEVDVLFARALEDRGLGDQFAFLVIFLFLF